MNNAEHAEQLLKETPMMRYELQSSLNTSQQRVSEILRKVGAHVVGYERAPKQGRPAPIYAIGDLQPSSRGWQFGAVNSVWQLGARA